MSKRSGSSRRQRSSHSSSSSRAARTARASGPRSRRQTLRNVAVIAVVVAVAAGLVIGGTALLVGINATDDSVAGRSTSITPRPAPTEAAISDDLSSAGAAFTLPSGAVDYVALGDSYAAGLGIAVQTPGTPCGRSTRNIATQLAADLEVDSFTDVACTGATTEDLSRPQTAGEETVAPQLDALSRDTDLVTVGMGANDFDIFGKIVGTCVRIAASDIGGSPCRDAYDDAGPGNDLLVSAAAVEDRAAQMLADIRAAAPKAAIVVLGYPAIFDGPGCAALGFTSSDAAWAAQVFATVDVSLSKAASAGGAVFLDTRPLTVDHGVCAARPWIAGFEPTEANPAAWHPGVSYTRAVATALGAKLTSAP